ncbi:MAG: class I SAM-dependent methyltransferase [Oscillospiraceae bacterium]|nr:class I SAM-dependent methyltransferase [Oscillospiraceae bacterium]
MDSVNKTLYIPLYGKALVSRKDLFLHDPRAEEIWAKEGFPLKGKSASQWLAYYMGMRAAVFDDWVRRQMAAQPDAVILHLGCGLDSRILRVDGGNRRWYDVDLPAVIDQRRRYYDETDAYRMIAADVRERSWLSGIHARQAIVVMEGISMYLTAAERTTLLTALCEHFEEVSLLTDCYSKLAARLSRIKNPINDVGVTQVYGVDHPAELTVSGLLFVQQHDMTPQSMIDQLPEKEQAVFRKLYAGKTSQKLYRLYEYRSI